MKKVLYFSYSSVPSYTANSIAVMNFCNELNKIYDLKVVCIKNKKIAIKYQDFYGVDSMNIKLIPKFFLKCNYFLYKVYALLLYKIFKPDVVYSRDIILNEFFCRHKIENIYEIHQIIQNDVKFNKRFSKILNKIGNNKYLKNIVCISNSLKNECIDFGINCDKLFVSPSGVSDRFFINTEFENTNKILYLGSIQQGKGIDNIIKLSNSMPNNTFYIVGGKKEQIMCENNNVIHIPWVEPSKVVDVVKSIPYAIMLFDDQDYKFHSPLKLFEYLAMGKIIIAGKSVGIDEIIIDGYNGFLVDSKDIHSIINKIKSIDDNPDLKSCISENAKKTAQSYKWKEKIKNLEKIL